MLGLSRKSGENTLMTTRTVTINAAFLQELKDDNEQLRALLEGARQACQTRPLTHVPARRLALLLAELRDQLAMHFSLEEAYGYFDEPVSVAPHLSEHADSLRKQHDLLYKQIAHLAETAENISRQNSNVRATGELARSVLEFHGRLQDHERQENDLIAQAYNVDIGVGD